jgi:hypothetical protein
LPRKVTFSREWIANQVEKNNELLAAKIPVPVSWEHRNDAKPGRFKPDDMATARAKGVAGWVEKYELDANGIAWANIEIPDEADQKQAEKVRFCSPEIDEFTDGDGKCWGEVFTHIALTPRPIQHNQPPIARLSFGPIRLSTDPEKGTDMADDKGDKGKKGEQDGGPQANPKLKDALTALAEFGLVLGDDTPNDFEAFLDRLIVAVNTKKAAEGNQFEEDEEEPPAPANPPGPVSLSFQKQHDAAVVFATGTIKGRIGRLLKTRRITAKINAGLESELKSVRLSFDKNGELKPNSLLAKIEAYEALEKDAAWSRRQPGGERLSHDVEVAARPSHADASPTPAQTKEAVKKISDMVGGIR